jgi:gliding motility-associated-like protein
MKNRYFLIFIISLLFSDFAFSQDCVTDPPLSPVLTSVSVQPETGNTQFTWTLSSSTGIVAYILYSYKNGDGMPLDTIRDPAATSYTVVNNASKYFSVSYVVAAMRLPRCTSILSNVINSIFETTSIDTCLKKIVVSWNRYPSYPVKVTNYSVLLSVNGGAYTQVNNSPNDTSFTLTDYSLDAEYCFVTRANLDNGGFSSSNKSCVSTKIQHPPQWINADQATLNPDGKVVVSFTVDPSSEIKHFSLEKKIGSLGSFSEIASLISSNGTVNYIDIKADTNVVNYYRLAAVNGCSLPVAESNQASNIVLSYNINADNIILDWNPYKTWLGKIAEYKIYANTGNGFVEKASVPASDSTYEQSYQQIMYEVTGNNVCFYLTATETSNPYGITGESKSSIVCTSPVEVITVPNVFTPNNDLKNDLFRPVLSFTPLSYELIISNRQGKVLYETRDYLASWNGSANGSLQPEGVYLWFLKLTTPSGKKISKTGTITVIK